MHECHYEQQQQKHMKDYIDYIDGYIVRSLSHQCINISKCLNVYISPLLSYSVFTYRINKKAIANQLQ